LGAARYTKAQVHRDCLIRTAQVLSLQGYWWLILQAGQVRPAQRCISPFFFRIWWICGLNEKGKMKSEKWKTENCW